MVVLTDLDPEEIKQYLVTSNDKFFMVPSRNPRNNYQVLWYSLPAPRSSERSCKVDILTPGILNIPSIPRRQINYMEQFPDLPLMPFLALLLLKLQGWSDHRDSPRLDMNEKQPIDEEDIDELLTLAVDDFGVELRGEKWIPKWFVRAARQRVGEFVDEFPESADSWYKIGFRI